MKSSFIELGGRILNLDAVQYVFQDEDVVGLKVMHDEGGETHEVITGKPYLIRFVF